MYDRVFKNWKTEELRRRCTDMNKFNETWIPSVKAGSYGGYELFDLATDPSQKVDVSKRHPRGLIRLKKQLLKTDASVTADAHDWFAEPAWR